MSTETNTLHEGERDEGVSRVAIVLIGEEEAFVDLFQQFPPRKYPLVFARDIAEAGQFCAAQAPQLLILPLDPSADTTALLELLRRSRARRVHVIGLIGSQQPSAEVAKLVDRVHSRDDSDALLASAAELLGERRAMPRVAMEVELELAGAAKVMATVISGRSLFIPHAAPLKGGQMVQLGIQTGHSVLRCWASVVRVGMGESGSSGFVLGVPERERDVRAYLDGLVRGVLLLERAELGGADPAAALPGRLMERLADRLAQQVSILHARFESQAVLTDALTTRLDGLVEADAKAVKWKDVRPVLTQKWSAQRDLIKRLIAKVDRVAADRSATTRLQGELERENELRERMEEQSAVIEALRARVDGLAEPADERGDLELARQTRDEVEKRLIHQTDLINDLSARVELISLRGMPVAEVDQARKTLEDHAAQLASLSLRLDELRDQIRLGRVDLQAMEGLQADLEQRRRGLEELARPVERLENQPRAPAADLTEYEEDVPTRQEAKGYPGQLFNAHAPPRSSSTTARAVAEDLSPTEDTASTEDTVSTMRPAGSHAALAPLSAPASSQLEAAGAPGLPSASSAKRPLLSYPWWWVTVATGCLLVGALFFMVLIGPGDDNPPPAEPSRGVAEDAEDEGAASQEVTVTSIARPAGQGARIVGQVGLDPVPEPPVPRTAEARDVVTRDAAETDAGAAERDAGAAERDAQATERDAGAAERYAEAPVDAAAPNRAAAPLSRSQARPAKRAPPSPRQLRRRYFDRAIELIEQQQYEASRRYLTRALEIKDGHSVRWLLARSHQRAGELWPAVHHMKKSLAKAPPGLLAKRHDALGQLYAELGKRAAACAQFSASLRAKPEHASAERHLAEHCQAP